MIRWRQVFNIFPNVFYLGRNHLSIFYGFQRCPMRPFNNCLDEAGKTEGIGCENRQRNLYQAFGLHPSSAVYKVS